MKSSIFVFVIVLTSQAFVQGTVIYTNIEYKPNDVVQNELVVWCAITLKLLGLRIRTLATVEEH